ncbi:MAG: glycogen/starch synthase [Bacteroidales bacterium]|jgi:starch synthase|nr:glycogen/starch synthase [Bacteroidales bacterium]MDD4394678.1 glycogen/starch synthase [Bacteroidales bacterium]
MGKKRILYIAPEIYPYLPESYLANICRFLPQGIQERENEIRTFMPKFGCINERKNQLHEVIRLSGQNIIVNNFDHPLIIKVASLQVVRMQIYFIDSDDFFRRKHIFYDEKGDFFADNDERMIFFAKGVIETVRKLGWNPDIVHCHGWMSSLVPIFIKTCYKDNPLFQDTRIVYSIYDDQFTQMLDANFAKKLEGTGIDASFIKHLRTPNYESLMQTAVDFSDAVVVAQDHINSKILSYLDNYPRTVFTHPQSDSYVDEYDVFYDNLVEKEPITF